ncbi:MAG TPA: lasso peptide biosynthesis B2 protein, partial [Thermoanaerobaculia bacterium]|nr:lasso peptide biosynthesis B2 protein [Thermoanaerobaculia bacterium]
MTGIEEDGRFEIAGHVRSAGGLEGAVLLDLRSGKYIALNPVAGRIWEGVERGETRAAIVSRLEGEIEAPPGRLRQDVDAFLAQLLAKGLIRERIGDAPFIPETAPEPVRPAEEEDGEAAVRFRPLCFLASWIGLVLADLLLGFSGFHRFHTLLGRIRVRGPERDSAALATELSRVVDHASAFYFKRAWCLQRSAVAMALMRFHGVPAKLAIGVHRVPFQAHAWV